MIHFRFSDELFILNAAQLASLVGSGADEIEALKMTLPAWAVLVGVGGRDLLPQERCDQQEADIGDIAQQNGLLMVPAVGGLSAEKAMNKAKSPCEGVYWKERLRGAFQDIFFTTTLDRTKEFVNKMNELVLEEGCALSGKGVYIQPLHMGTAYHVEFTIPYNPESKAETDKAKNLYKKASIEFGAMNAFYSRPYGICAQIQMNKDAMSKKTLDKLKGIFDPNGILNPGKLCL